MISRSLLLIIAPAIALTAACATGPGEGEGKTRSTSQALCTMKELCDTSSSTTVTAETTTVKGAYTPPAEPAPDKVEAMPGEWECNCAHTGPNGSPLMLFVEGTNAKGATIYSCREVAEDCCKSASTAREVPTTPDDPPPTGPVDPGVTCGPSSYVSVYNPCGSWFVRCNAVSCWCSAYP